MRSGFQKTIWGCKRYLRIAGLFCLMLCADMMALSDSTGPAGSNVQAVHALGYQGQDIHVGFVSVDNVRISHEAFFEKDQDHLPTSAQHAFIHDVIGDGVRVSNHDTNLAGILISSGGQSYPDQVGVAPMAYLHNIRVSDNDGVFKLYYIQQALDEMIVNQNCRVITTGFQLPIQGDGDNIYSLMYDYYAQHYNVVFVNAAGNYSGYYPDVTQISAFGDAYNGITTAGLINTGSTAVYDKVGSSSLPGPTDDLRKKPDLAAPSSNQTVPASTSDTAWTVTTGTTQGYTSWAIGHTAGVAALLLSFVDANGIVDGDRNSVIKAVIVNATFPNIDDKNGGPTVDTTDPIDQSWVWNADRGYGRIDAMRSLELLQASRLAPSVTSSAAKGWAYESLSKNDQDMYNIQGIENERLVLTLTWNRRVVWNDRKPQGTIESGELVSYLADLDLEISDPDGQLIVENISDIDNLEKVDLLLNKTGTYQVRVINRSTSESAAYGLAYELLEPIPGDCVVDYIVDTRDLAAMTQQWVQSGKGMDDFAILAAHWMETDGRYYGH